MFNYIFIFFMFVHGIIHFLGFGKAFGYGNINQLSQEISKPIGIVWLLVGLLFVLAAVLSITQKDFWSYFALIAAVLSQILIILNWQDAKFGTIPNILILAVIIIGILQERNLIL
jgi:prepilin signal peptidase PulO-like enzyme (type II secretory pathway)